jgi:hypothetical protein
MRGGRNTISSVFDTIELTQSMYYQAEFLVVGGPKLDMYTTVEKYGTIIRK